MTTINNSQNLIEKVGGIEKAREIAFDPLHPQMTHVSNDGRHWVNEAFAHIPEIQCQIESMIRIDDLRTAIAEHDSKIKCWSCDKYMTKSQRSANDGFCIHCSNEVDLGCNHNFEDVTIYGDSHKTYQCTICEFRDEEAVRHG